MTRFRLCAILTVVTFAIMAGCAGPPNAVEKFLFNPNPTTNTTVVWVTNGTSITLQTNHVVMYDFKVKPEVTEYLRMGETVAGAFGPQFSLLIGALGAGLAGWAGMRNKKLNATVENQVGDMQVAREIIAKIAPPAVSAGFKEHLIASQKADGVKSVIEKAVDEQKGDSAPKAAAMLITKTP